MYRVEASLAAWKKLYLALAEAQLRLNAARSNPPSEDVLVGLRAEVDRLRIESDRALDAVHAEMARFKTKPKTSPDRLRPN